MYIIIMFSPTSNQTNVLVLKYFISWRCSIKENGSISSLGRNVFTIHVIYSAEVQKVASFNDISGQEKILLQNETML